MKPMSPFRPYCFPDPEFIFENKRKKDKIRLLEN